jgi:2-hydroxy-6-oxonona-2,4-dienedioate hydrolase
MVEMKMWKVVALSVLGLLTVGGAAVGISYGRDMAAARARLAAGARTVDTACGEIEYGEQGDGPPVLVIHGAGGGYDQGLALGNALLGDGYHLIAPSRFGYLNAPVPEDLSAEAQADIYACLLDELGIERVAVVGVSAGGPSSLAFAERYPDRTAALVLVSAMSHAEPRKEGAAGTQEQVRDTLLKSDLAYWLFVNAAKPTLLETLGVSRVVQAGMTPEDHTQVDDFLTSMYPMSQRAPGMAADGEIITALDLPLEDITAPTLVFHARDDTLVPYTHGQYSAETIPGARFITLPDGGHLLVGHYDEIHPVIVAFLAGIE